MVRNVVSSRGISDETVEASTGRDWSEWFRILDRFDVRKNGRTRAAKYLFEEQKVGHWWAQAITQRYECEKGLRRR